MSATPVSLIERIRSDRTGSDWNKFVQIYTPLLRRWLYRSITHPADIEDLIQDILTVVVTKLPEFQHTGAPGAFRASPHRGLPVEKLLEAGPTAASGR